MLIDISMPIRPGAVFRRGSPPVEIATRKFQWLAFTGVNAVGIDAPGLGRDRRHGEFDRVLARSDVYVIENLANLRRIPEKAFRVYCLPLSIENIDAIPARVLVDTSG